jgi:hypothetical protein
MPPQDEQEQAHAQQWALVFCNDSFQYDMIRSANFLSKVGLKLDYISRQMVWYD